MSAAPQRSQVAHAFQIIRCNRQALHVALPCRAIRLITVVHVRATRRLLAAAAGSCFQVTIHALLSSPNFRSQTPYHLAPHPYLPLFQPSRAPPLPASGHEQHARTLERVQKSRALGVTIPRVSGFSGLAAKARPHQAACDAIWGVVPHAIDSKPANGWLAAGHNSI